MTGAPVLLACLISPGADASTLAGWARRLAPEVVIQPVADSWESPANGLPLALLGAYEQGAAAVALTERLDAKGRGPSQLIVCECPPPEVRDGQLSCRVTALAGPALAAAMAGWRRVTTAAFALRLLGGFGAPPHGTPSDEIAVALKEELQVWPH